MAFDPLCALTLGYVASRPVVSKGLSLLTLGLISQVAESIQPGIPSQPTDTYGGGGLSPHGPALVEPPLPDPAVIAEEIGRAIVEFDAEKAEEVGPRSRLLALTMGLAASDEDKARLVAAAAALLAPDDDDGA